MLDVFHDRLNKDLTYFYSEQILLLLYPENRANGDPGSAVADCVVTGNAMLPLGSATTVLLQLLKQARGEINELKRALDESDRTNRMLRENIDLQIKRKRLMQQHEEVLRNKEADQPRQYLLETIRLLRQENKELQQQLRQSRISGYAATQAAVHKAGEDSEACVTMNRPVAAVKPQDSRIESEILQPFTRR